MKHTISILLLLFLVQFSLGQVKYTAKDSLVFLEKAKLISTIEAGSNSELIQQLGASFLDTPYVEKTLEIGDTEQLVVNLQGLDCTTYVENVMAFGLLHKNRQNNFEAFTENLETIRYRNGKLNGYPSRLHYFTDWIRNNEGKGLVRDITSELGGSELAKPIDFMGTHRPLYPFLVDDKNYNAILQVEESLAQHALCILPQEKIEANEDLIQTGDIIALATSIKGLDVTHTGFAVRKNGRIHLMHASIQGSVRITEVPLVDYLKKIKSNIGIIVARPTLLSP